MTELDPEARALFQSAQRDLAITPDERERLDRALAAKLGVAAGIGVAATLAAKGATATLPPTAAGGAAVAGTASTGLLAAKVIGVLAIVGAASGGAMLYTRQADRAPVVSSNPPAAVASVAVASVTAIALVPPTSVEAVASAAVPPPSSAPPSPGPSLVVATPARSSNATVTKAKETRADVPPPQTDPEPQPEKPARPTPSGAVAAETGLLREADAALRSGDAARALSLLDELARTHPNGVLRQERSAERVFALCKLGRTHEARVEAERFLREAGDSPLAASVRASCGGRSDTP